MIKKITATILLINATFLSFGQIKEQKKAYEADLIIFSRDRPIQLLALLESINKHVAGLGEIRTIYRSSSKEFDEGYQEVKKDFPNIIFLKQGENPENDFKPLTMKSIVESPNDYIIFAVDDIIVKDFVDINEATKALEATEAYGFYLRLGKNITFHYLRNKNEKLPPLKYIANDIYQWSFRDGQYYWRYPNTVDMTIYRKETVMRDFENMSFTNPNTLEARWSTKTRKIINKTGLCYVSSKIVNIPLNRVQNRFRNRHMNLYDSKELLDKFNKKLKINIAPLFQILNTSAHMNYVPEFIEKD